MWTFTLPVDTEKNKGDTGCSDRPCTKHLVTRMIYLHIGINKTGSSSIQNALHDTRQALRRDRVLYPETGLGTPNEGHGYHYLLSKKLGFANFKTDPDECLANAETLRAELDREIAETRARSVIFSSEFFTLRRNMEPVRRFLDGLDVRVVVYLRRHDLWYPSLYSQALKSVVNPRWEPGLEGYVEWARKSKAGYPSFGKMLDAWSDVVGAGNIRVRAFEKESMKHDLIEDFFDLCGIRVPACLAGRPAPTINKAPDAEKLAALEEVKRTSVSEAAKRLVVNAFLSSKSTGGQLQMSPELQQEILELHSEDYARIARVYLGNRSGVLFRQPI